MTTQNPAHDANACARYTAEYLAAMKEPDQVERARLFRSALARWIPSFQLTFAAMQLPTNNL